MRGKSSVVKEPKKLEADEYLPDGSHYYLVNWGGDEICRDLSWQQASVVEDRCDLIADFLISTRIAKVDEETQTINEFWVSPCGIRPSKHDLFRGFSFPAERTVESSLPVLLSEELLPRKILEYFPERNMFKVLMCGVSEAFSLEASVLLGLSPGLVADYFLDASRYSEEEIRGE
jgi:hypothetical protein